MAKVAKAPHDPDYFIEVRYHSRHGTPSDVSVDFRKMGTTPDPGHAYSLELYKIDSTMVDTRLCPDFAQAVKGIVGMLSSNIPKLHNNSI